MNFSGQPDSCVEHSIHFFSADQLLSKHTLLIPAEKSANLTSRTDAELYSMAQIATDGYRNPPED